MLKDATAYSGFSAGDIGAEMAFYAETLGVAVSEENGMLTLELAGGQRVLIYPEDSSGPMGLMS